MTTVIDPAGTPVAVFNRSGTAIIDLPVVVGPSEPLTPIPHYAGDMVVRYFPSSTGSPEDGGMELPAAAEIGDTVEIGVDLATSGAAGTIKVYAPSGENIDGLASVNAGIYLRVRKISETDWRRG